jgi:hypothetical protein
MSKFLNHGSQLTVWSFDIDGVFNDYPAVWLDFIFRETNKRYESKEMARDALGENYWAIKEKYRMGDYKYQVPVNPDAQYLTSALKNRGDRIIIATTRPFNRYPFMKDKTKAWLESNNILFDSLIRKNDLYKKDFDIHVDDELKDILQVKSFAKSKKYILLSSDKSVSEIDGVEVIRSLKELL